MYINLSMDTIYKSVKNICKTTLRDEMYNFEEKEEFPLRRPLMEPWGPTPEGPPHLPSATLAKILTPSSRSRRTSYLTCLPLELHCPWDYPPPLSSITPWIFITPSALGRLPFRQDEEAPAVAQALREQKEITLTIRRINGLHFYANTCPNALIASPITHKKGMKLLDPRYLTALWTCVY